MTINKNILFDIQNLLKLSEQKAELLIVTKNRSIDDIVEFINLNQKNFGENRVQEAKKKFIDTGLKDKYALHLSLIGPLQSNKVISALTIFDTIQSIDRFKIIDEIFKGLKSGIKIRTKNFFIQVNIGLEEQKSGVNPCDLKEIYQYALNHDLSIEGIMCIPPNHSNPEIYFKKMIDLKNNINPNFKVSMGMSNDYQLALACGSNILRVGSLLFND